MWVDSTTTYTPKNFHSEDGSTKSFRKFDNHSQYNTNSSALLLKRLVADFSSRRSWFETRPGNMGFVVEKVALGQSSHRVLRSSLVFIIPSMFHTHSYIYHRHYSNSVVDSVVNPLNVELNPICYLVALLAQRFLHVSRIRVKSLTLRLLMS